MKTYTCTVQTDVPAERLWAVFSDLEHWNLWDKGLEGTRWVDRDRRIFQLTPQGGKPVTIRVSQYEEGRLWTDRTAFPLAVLEGEHRFIPLPNGGTEARTTMRLKGPLAFLWDRLVVRGIAAGMDEQTEALINKARSATVKT
jgi:hypothetical protein